MPPGMERSPDLVWSGHYSLLAKEVLHLSHLEEGSEPLLWRSKPQGRAGDCPVSEHPLHSRDQIDGFAGQPSSDHFVAHKPS